MNFLICITFVGFVCSRSTTSPTSSLSSDSTSTASDVISTTTVGIIPTTTGSTNKSSSMTTAGMNVPNEVSTTSPSSTTVNSSISQHSDGFVHGNENGILGITGTHDAVNLEERAMTDASDGTQEIISTAKTDNVIPSNKVVVPIGEKSMQMNIHGGISKTSNTDKMSDIEMKLFVPSDINNGDQTSNTAINSVSDKTSETIAKENSITDVKAGGSSITVNEGRDGKNLRLVNVGPETIQENISNNSVESMSVENADKTLTHTNDQKNDKLTHEPAAVNKILVTGDVNLDAINADKKKDCNVKNSTCVPTREELIASGVKNVDSMQHKIDINPPKFIPNELSSKSTAAETNADKPTSGCNRKNSTCVPTREELIASGVKNVDSMQHKIDINPPKFIPNELSSKSTAAETNAEKPTSGCNVENSTCVPSKEDLMVAGANMNVKMQHKVDENMFIGQVKQTDPMFADRNIASAPDNKISTSTETISRDIASDSGKDAQNPSFTDSEKGTPKLVVGPTKASKLTTVQQIREPGPTTQQTKSTETTTASSTFSTAVNSNLMSPKKTTLLKEKAVTTQRLTSAVTSEMTSTSEQTTKVTTEFQTCPNTKCLKTCTYGRKVDSNGCEICECKFTNSCPRVIPTSRLLCLLRAVTSQSCQTDADCRRNRICCPGTCGPSCRRASRRNSMLLSMLVD